MRGETWSRGTNSSLPFGVNVNLNLSIVHFQLVSFVIAELICSAPVVELSVFSE